MSMQPPFFCLQIFELYNCFKVVQTYSQSLHTAMERN